VALQTPDAFESARKTAEQITERTQEAIANYFNWLQNAMQTSPWGNTDLNKKLTTASAHWVGSIARCLCLSNSIPIVSKQSITTGSSRFICHGLSATSRGPSKSVNRPF
jgi:hypothetical protein